MQTLFRMFTWPDQLKTHLLKSHNEGTWFTCHICGKQFTLSGNLKDHIRRHEGVKPYVCEECPKCFCTAGELKHHKLRHSDVKHFCCGKCGKFYKRTDTLIDVQVLYHLVIFLPISYRKYLQFHVNRGDTGREVTVNTRSNTEVSNTWPAGCMAETYLDFQIFVYKCCVTCKSNSRIKDCSYLCIEKINEQKIISNLFFKIVCFIMYKNAVLLLAVSFPVNLIDAAKFDTSDAAC